MNIQYSKFEFNVLLYEVQKVLSCQNGSFNHIKGFIFNRMRNMPAIFQSAEPIINSRPKKLKEFDISLIYSDTLVYGLFVLIYILY